MTETVMDRPARPLPQINSINRPFWDACLAGRLDLQRCDSPSCGRYVYYPRVCCPYCGGVLEPGDKASDCSGSGAWPMLPFPKGWGASC